MSHLPAVHAASESRGGYLRPPAPLAVSCGLHPDSAGQSIVVQQASVKALRRFQVMRFRRLPAFALPVAPFVAALKALYVRRGGGPRLADNVPAFDLT